MFIAFNHKEMSLTVKSLMEFPSVREKGLSSFETQSGRRSLRQERLKHPVPHSKTREERRE